MTGKKAQTIGEYISSFPADVQAVLENVRKTIKKVAPDAEEAISYGMPAFKLNDRSLVYFAGWKNHVSIYPVPAGDEEFQQEISLYKRSRGTIQFPLAKPVPYPLVERMIAFLVEERAQEAPIENGPRPGTKGSEE